MAYGETFHPAGTQRDVKVRGPVWVGVFSIVTLGIYAIYWFYVSAKDLSEYGKAKGRDLGQSPIMSLLAVTIGWVLLFIPPIVALVRFVKRSQQAQVLAGREQTLNGWLCLIMQLVGLSFIFNAYVQAELNKAWAGEGGPVPMSSNEAPVLQTSAQPATAAAPSELGTPERPAS
jgi:Domain of unknown function (DUF4234)